MTTQEICNKIKELEELQEMAHELDIEIEAIKDSLKLEMTEQKTEELIVGTHVIHWTTVLTNRFDSTSFKKVMPDVYKAYTKQTTSRRFTIS